MREQDLLAGHHARHAHGLPGLVLQHPRLHVGGGEAARPGGARPRAVHPRDHERAEPPDQPPGVARHQRARARRHHGVLLHVPRAGEGARPGRDDRRRADEHPLLPGRRLRRRHAARLRDPPARVHRPDAGAHRRVRGPAVGQPDLGGPHARDRRAAGRPAPGPRRHRARPARRRRRPRPAQDRAVLGLRALRLPGAARRERRRVRPLQRAAARDARVGADHRPGARRHAGGQPHRRRPQGRPAAARRALHLDGGADPPLQAGHRGLPGARGRGLLGRREPPRRARLLRGGRRLAQAAAGPHARPQLREPAGAAADGPGRLPRGPHHFFRGAPRGVGRGRGGARPPRGARPRRGGRRGGPW